MKSEHRKTSTRNAARDIEYLLSFHQEKVSKKLAILFSLMLAQNHKTRQLMIEAIIPTYFNFLYSKIKKKHSPEFKKAVQSVLLNALTKGFDEEQAKKHILGYLVSINTIEEVYEIRRKAVWNGWSVKMPNKEDFPKTVYFIDECMTLQNLFLSISGYQAKRKTEIIMLAMLDTLLYANENDNGHRDIILLPEILIFFILLLAEAYLLLSRYFSADEYQNKLVMPIALTSILVDIVAITIIIQTAIHLNNNNENRKNIALQDAANTLTNKIPNVITITTHNKTTGQTSHAYSLPIFNNIAPISPQLESSPESNEAPSNERHHKPKTRSPFFMGLFKPSIEPKAAHRQNNDTFKLDGVNYYRLYNQDKKQTNIFIGYTKESLAQFTTPQNKNTFKKLMQYPCMVPPKGSQGFVFMKNKREDETLLPFKLKTLSDERLLFSLESDAKLDNEHIKLYQLSSSATHNQFSRLKRK
jgi:hypothetical protein